MAPDWRTLKDERPKEWAYYAPTDPIGMHYGVHKSLQAEWGIDQKTVDRLSAMNDGDGYRCPGMSFAGIANWIERNL